MWSRRRMSIARHCNWFSSSVCPPCLRRCWFPARPCLCSARSNSPLSIAIAPHTSRFFPPGPRRPAEAASQGAAADFGTGQPGNRPAGGGDRCHGPALTTHLRKPDLALDDRRGAGSHRPTWIPVYPEGSATGLERPQGRRICAPIRGGQTWTRTFDARPSAPLRDGSMKMNGRNLRA